MKRFTPILAIAAIAAAVAPSAAQARIAPLGWGQAHSVARNAAWSLPTPGGTDSVKTTFCDTWSRWRIDCGVEADGTKTTRTWDDCKDLDYDYNCIGGWDYSTEDTWCMATVDVHKDSHTGRVWAKREIGSLDCFSG